mgnify:CR=1 FL=1
MSNKGNRNGRFRSFTDINNYNNFLLELDNTNINTIASPIGGIASPIGGI